MQTINVLWTGGLDSTFRICELARHAVSIQPYYIVEERSSEKQELLAIKNISNFLRRNDFVKGELLEPVLINLKELPPPISHCIANSWQHLKNKYQIGSQYEYLARVAEHLNLILEVGLEKSPRSKAYNALTNEGIMTVEDFDGVKRYRLIPEKSSPEVIRIFGRMRFPKLLFEISKLEEVELLKTWGMENVVNMTWFCHTPVLGMPCGRCNPCRDALNEGFAWRVPMKGRILGFIRGCRNVIKRNLLNAKK